VRTVIIEDASRQEFIRFLNAVDAAVPAGKIVHAQGRRRHGGSTLRRLAP
jgi:hypothetical protein